MSVYRAVGWLGGAGVAVLAALAWSAGPAGRTAAIARPTVPVVLPEMIVGLKGGGCAAVQLVVVTDGSGALALADPTKLGFWQSDEHDVLGRPAGAARKPTVRAVAAKVARFDAARLGTRRGREVLERVVARTAAQTGQVQIARAAVTDLVIYAPDATGRCSG